MEQGYLTDEELKHYYLNSKMCIIPLVESSQPSGQSVALQSMSLGIPVMISRTSGFWDDKEFFQEKNIIFVEENTPENWVNKIKLILNNDKLLNQISTNSRNLINEKNNLEIFYNNLLMYLHQS